MRPRKAAGRFPGGLAARLAAAGCLAAALALSACLAEDGPSTETGNPALAGILRDTSGRPAAGALVRLYRIQPTADTSSPAGLIRLDSLRTGADGAYRFDSLPAGAVYSLEASDAERRTFSLLPSAEVPAGARRFLRRDTLVLRPPGRLRGSARRDSNPRPPGVVGEAGILVRVVGLDRATYTDSAGRYALADIPEGTYRIHYAASDGNYLGKTAGPVPVPAGADVELAPVVLDWSPFVAPPGPAGLSVTPDSAAGVIHLRWNRVFVSNFDHYRILRSDSLSAAAADTFRTRDTAYADTVRHLPAGRILRYRVQAVNALGNASGNDVQRPIPVPAPGRIDTGSLEISALVLSGGVPARALVRLYALSPPGAAPVDTLPRGLTLVDSAQSGADGRARFAGRPAGRYSLTALSGTGGDMAARVGVVARREGAPDTLRLAAPGGFQGVASRRGLWCSHGLKQNQDIEVSLVGMPRFTVTQFDGRFDFRDVPAGEHRAEIMALPRGCFHPETVAVSVAPGRATALGEVGVRPDSSFIPKVAGLRVAASAGAVVTLAWNPVPYAYSELEGYEVFRRDSSQAVTASSGLLADTAWTDDLSGLAPGTEVSYVVRAVAKGRRPGAFGGDAKGRPVYFTAP